MARSNRILLLVAVVIIGATSGHVLGALAAVIVVKFIVLPMAFPVAVQPPPAATTASTKAKKTPAATKKAPAATKKTATKKAKAGE